MTERLYYEDSYLREFVANLVRSAETAKGFEVVLDQTAFYPTSGGQPHDLGLIEEYPVQEVYENQDGEIIHSVTRPVEGKMLRCFID